MEDMEDRNKKTHTNPFSKREVEILRSNPNVRRISETSVSFTEEFRELLFEEKCHGKSVTETLRSHGIDPEILGQSRIDGLKYTLNKKSKQSGDFSDQRSENYRRPSKTGNETVEQRVKLLEHELAYTRQEVEFLKKIQTANMEAQKEWESGHRQK